MSKVIVKVDGMMCGMCEAHIADTVRKVYPEAKKVKASRKKGEVSFVIDEAPDEQRLKEAITETGYTFVSLE
ncbi:MAG: heavy-metal-associated domain-containing protein [Clostridiales bacterium]|nr:heavy-metal-associated domain-containing protein [Clostridiales bacterium]